MRSVLILLVALLGLAIAPACETTEPDPGPYDRLADNACGEQARCRLEECLPLWDVSTPEDVERCFVDDDCTPDAAAYVDCTASCEMSPCPDGDDVCRQAQRDLNQQAGGAVERCGTSVDSYTQAECEESLAFCDDVPDPMPSM